MLGTDQTAASKGRLFPSDLEEVIGRNPAVFAMLQGDRILLTGGSGFIGRWMLESLLWANESLGLDVHITVLSRDPEGFARRAPHLAHASHVELLQGDIQAFKFPAARIDRVVHLAAETNTQLSNPDPEVYFDVIVGGTRRVLDLVERVGATSLMIASSGAVYGKQPPTAESLSEDDPYAPQPTRPGAAYGEAKRSAELLAYARAERIGFSLTVARCFAFVGPYLPLDSGFAVGNFIRDAISTREITVNGDGSPRRTYMYASDMAAWLWSIAVQGRSGRPYNVGSDQTVTIAELARLVASSAGGDVAVKIRGDSGQVGVGDAYVPDISRARTELGLTVTVGLNDALARTVSWHRLGLPAQPPERAPS